MSKHAIRSFSDGLRRELHKSDIKVITIEPTMYRTPIADWNSIKNNIDVIWNQTPIEVQSGYNEKWRNFFEKRTELTLKLTRKQTNEVIDALIEAITLEKPQIYYRCGSFMDLSTLWPMSYLPEYIQDFILNYTTKKGALVRFLNFFSFKSKNYTKEKNH